MCLFLEENLSWEETEAEANYSAADITLKDGNSLVQIRISSKLNNAWKREVIKPLRVFPGDSQPSNMLHLYFPSNSVLFSCFQCEIRPYTQSLFLYLSAENDSQFAFIQQ